MPTGKFLINFVVALVIYFALFTVYGMLIPDANPANWGEGFGQREMPMEMYMIAGHIIQTLAFVWLFMKIVTQQCWKMGALVGLVIGCFLAGTDLVYFAGMKIPEGFIMAYIPADLVVSAIVGAVLGKMTSSSA